MMMTDDDNNDNNDDGDHSALMDDNGDNDDHDSIGEAIALTELFNLILLLERSIPPGLLEQL